MWHILNFFTRKESGEAWFYLLLACQICYWHVRFVIDMSDLLLTCQICYWHVRFVVDMSDLLLTCHICCWHVWFVIDVSDLLLTCQICYWHVRFVVDMSDLLLTCQICIHDNLFTNTPGTVFYKLQFFPFIWIRDFQSLLLVYCADK